MSTSSVGVSSSENKFPGHLQLAKSAHRPQIVLMGSHRSQIRKIFRRVVTVSVQVPSLPKCQCAQSVCSAIRHLLRLLSRNSSCWLSKLRCFVRTLETHWNAIYRVISSCSFSNSGFSFCDIPYFSQHSSASFKLICHLARNIFLKVYEVDNSFHRHRVSLLVSIHYLFGFKYSFRYNRRVFPIGVLIRAMMNTEVVFVFYTSQKIFFRILFLCPVSFSVWLCVPFMISMIDFMHFDTSSGRCLSLYIPGGKLEQPHLILTCLHIPTFSALTA